MKRLLLLLPVLALTSCSTLKKVMTLDNLDRALIIYDAGRDIYDAAAVTPDK